MRPWTFIAFVGIGCGTTVATPPRAETPTPSPAPSASAAIDDGARVDAETAIHDLAALYDRVDDTCRERLVTPATACAEVDAFRAIATRYQARFASEEDPRNGSGRIDELPRFGGPRATVDGMVKSLQNACDHRCEVTRALTIGTLQSDAFDRCDRDRKDGLRACAELRKKMGAAPGAEIDDAITACTGECERRSAAAIQDARDEALAEARRPRTHAQSIVCFRGCMKECTGGRVIVAADGSFTDDGKCGTCQKSCGADCAVR